METLLVIDQGSHSSRALVFNRQGHLLAKSQHSVVMCAGDNGVVEQDIRQTLDSITACLAELSDHISRDSLLTLQGASLIAQRSSFLACRRSDLAALTPIISWQDTRSRSWMVHQHMDAGLIHQMTGLHLNAHYSASKMRWLLDNDPVVQAAADADDLIFVPLTAFLCQRLVGAAHFEVDRDIAARTLLCRFGGRDWDDELLNMFGLERRWLPAIVDSFHAFGDLKVADQSIPLLFTGGDQSLLPMAWGEEALHASVMINAGSGAFIQAVERKPRKQADVPTQLLHVHLHLRHNGQLEDCVVLEGTVNGAATALDWLWQDTDSPLSFEELEAALDSVRNPPIFINRLRGSGSPYWLYAGKPWFEEKEGDSLTLPAKAVAVVESIIFLLVDNLVLMHQTKMHINRIYISGGLSRSSGFCQKLANVSDKTVLRMDDSEASARGAAIYVFMRQGTDDIDDHEFQKQADQFFPLLDKSLNGRYMRHRKCMEDAQQHNQV